MNYITTANQIISMHKYIVFMLTLKYIKMAPLDVYARIKTSFILRGEDEVKELPHHRS